MPLSRSRKKSAPTAQPAVAKIDKGNPAWLVPTMLGLMILGLAWIVTYYVTGRYPIPGLDNWNLLIGFVILFAGFGLTLRWR
ncbi:cell division protein CrgA [Cellulomonas carbonis]|uniref:Cell division protein CrgA n=1 Tax=Cellulomonas carbonis T26 TaxID=947969 RepID=A0A0A0BWF2_9CELL|nr:cell division protein CrgA [Cellulomonas carbonis]KGM12280.1 septation inhibitor protein [Cellulomonas carbonis T26]GGC01313.1 cell division protein CrgA [Cellulomonas carbonis]